MTKQIFSALKVTTLALVLSFGLSYVYAWTAPTATPPSGNVSAPINTSGTAQSKTGNFTAPNLIDTSATAQAKTGALTVGGTLDLNGGTGTAYNTAPIEVATTLTPRISFHWPGVVASQLGMDSAGTIRTYNNPGTGYENFAANTVIAKGGMDAGNAGGAYSLITMRDDESPNGVKYIHANSNNIGFLSGQGGWIARWDNNGNLNQTGGANFSGNVTVGGSSVCRKNGTNCPVSNPFAGGSGSCSVSFAKGYSCTMTRDTVGRYSVNCGGGENHGECRGLSSGMVAYNECNTWNSGKGWQVSYKNLRYELRAIGKENNHTSPYWVERSCVLY